MRYKSKPHTIQAIRFGHQGLAKWPDWVISAYETGKIQITFNHKQKYITIYDENGGERKVYPGEYLCTNDSGTLFPLTLEELQRGFEES